VQIVRRQIVSQGSLTFGADVKIMIVSSSSINNNDDT